MRLKNNNTKREKAHLRNIITLDFAPNIPVCLWRGKSQRVEFYLGTYLF